jgi:hypothetical protein
MTRKEMADAVDEIDRDIAALQASKRDLFVSYRDDLAVTMDKDAIKAEVAALKAAIRRRQKFQADIEAASVADLADEIFDEITSLAPRATHVHEAA